MSGSLWAQKTSVFSRYYQNAEQIRSNEGRSQQVEQELRRIQSEEAGRANLGLGLANTAPVMNASQNRYDGRRQNEVVQRRSRLNDALKLGCRS